MSDRNRDLDTGFGVMPNTFYGQHFLVDPRPASLIADSLEPDTDIVEIGSGTGALTEPLLTAVGHLGVGRVIAYETDDRCIPGLTALSEQHDGRLRIINGDFLKASDHDLNDLKPYDLVGNVPYQILPALIRKMTHLKFGQAILMMPERFKDSVTISTPGYGWTIDSMLARGFFNVEELMHVPKEAFDPPPPVESYLVKITRKDTIGATGDDPIAQAYRKIAGSLETDETIASVLKKTSIGGDGKVEASTGSDHKRHRKDRRSRKNDFIVLKNQYNSTGNIDQEVLIQHASSDLFTEIEGSIGNADRMLNVPLIALDQTSLRKMCATIEGVINRRFKNKSKK